MRSCARAILDDAAAEHGTGDAPWTVAEHPAGVLAEAAEALVAAGVASATAVSAADAAGAVLIAEAINAAAKTDPSFYAIKPRVWAAAVATRGVTAWRGPAGDVTYLAAEGAGEASAHDPWGELAFELARAGLAVPTRPDHVWSGIERQPHALSILGCAAMQRLYAAATLDDGALAGARPASVLRWAARLGAGWYRP